MPDLARKDVTLHYEIDGTGPPLLLIAGMLSDSATWVELVPKLTDQFTVIRPDNRTTGRTRPLDAPADCALMAQDAMALMDHLGFNQFHVAGHSLGGLLSLELASAAPDRVATLTILASGRIRSPRLNAIFRSLLAIRQTPDGEEMWLRALYPWVFGNNFFKNPETVELAIEAARAYPFAQQADAMARQIDALEAFRPMAELDRVTSPTLVLYGGEDVLLPPDKAQEDFAALPNATHETISHAGHSIVWDATEDVADRLLTFLQANPIAR